MLEVFSYFVFIIILLGVISKLISFKELSEKFGTENALGWLLREVTFFIFVILVLMDKY